MQGGRRTREMKVTRVTRDNFQELLPTLKAIITSSTFLCIDTELTGLSAARAHQYHVLDTPQDRYTKVRHSAMNFGLLQYGLAAYRWLETEQKWDCQCFSFYLWPRVGTSVDNGRYMLMQLSSIEFLTSFDYDFNLTFSKGIPFLSRADEGYKRNQIERLNTEQSSNSNEQQHAEVSIEGLQAEDRAFLENQLNALTAHIQSGAEKPYQIPPCNGFHRRLLHQEVPKRFASALPGKTPLLVKEGKDRVSGMRVMFITPEEHSAQQNEQYHSALTALNEEIGFRHILDYAVAAGKPIIGHNCFMDFCHTFQKFLDRLPESYEEFKGALHGTLPLLFDTKYLAARTQDLHQSDSTSLGDLYHYLRQHPVAMNFPMNMEAAEETERFHDAGFDAYCTGKVFLGLCALLAHRDGKPAVNCVSDVLSITQPYQGLSNRFFMMQSDCDSMNLAGQDEAPDRSALVHISGFDSSNKTSNLQTALQEAGFAADARAIIWMGDDSVCVRLESAEQARQLLKRKHLKMQTGPKAALSSYDKYAKEQQSQRDSLPSKRKLIQYDQA